MKKITTMVAVLSVTALLGGAAQGAMKDGPMAGQQVQRGPLAVAPGAPVQRGPMMGTPGTPKSGPMTGSGQQGALNKNTNMNKNMNTDTNKNTDTNMSKNMNTGNAQ